jgi:glycosyltransferase involved in cell wall biosynthesis
MIEQPMVSVLMTAYNREKFIAEAIESVLSSSYSNFELIIVDDCSIDGSVAIARQYEAKDNRVKLYINEKNLGDYPNRNKAASYANGTYLKYVDSDDAIFPHTLEVMVNAMEKNAEAGFGISSRYKHKPPVGEYYLFSPTEAYKTHFFDFGFLDNGPSFTIIRRLIFEAAGGFGIKRNVSDFEMWLKLASKNKVLVLPDELIHWRQHSGQEFILAPDCYLEHQFTILKKALHSPNSPLMQSDSKRLIKKYKRMTIEGIVRFSLKQKSIKTFSRLMQSNDFGFNDLFVLFKKVHE